jgi:malonate decarboxylase delta subunit
VERLAYRLTGGRALTATATSALVGVVASGNLEVLVEAVDLDGACEVIVNTAAQGFGEIWKAVVDDFFSRHALSNVRVSINDNGATPAVVALRLDQAVAELFASASTSGA